MVQTHHVQHPHHQTVSFTVSTPQDEAVVRPSIWQYMREGPLKVAIIGSGNWGSAIARVVGQNTAKYHFFDKEVKMYVYEENFNGRPLTQIINTTHVNEKYLPGVVLPENVVAVPDIKKTVAGAHLLVFVMPHQFVQSICNQIKGHVLPGAKAISLVKGFDCNGNKINLITDYISAQLGIECCMLSGANVADGVAREEFSESTIGFRDTDSAQIFQQLFDTPYFRVSCVRDIAGVELCGALKNVVAIGCGFIDGLGYGTNTKSAIMRIGLLEMRKFAQIFYDGIVEETFWDSAGLADLITTCFGGRNRKCGEYFVKSGKSWVEIERSLLKGQKLQGVHTARDVYVFLKAQNKLQEFPLFSVIYEIADCGAPAFNIVKIFMSEQPRLIKAEFSPIAKL